MNILIRRMNEKDPEAIVHAFQEQGVKKAADLYLCYLEQQKKGERVSIVAEVDGLVAGYTNVLWTSSYPFFQENGIPEVNDFNVFEKFRRQGVGTRLMDHAEAIIKERSDIAGIGVGLFASYGNAQILYVRRGYIPDGKGIYNEEGYVQNGDTIVVNHDVGMFLMKQLR